MRFLNRPTRRWWRRVWKRTDSHLFWVFPALLAVVGALTRIVPQASWVWTVIIWVLAALQLLQGVWKERKEKPRLQTGDFFKGYIAHVLNVMETTPDVSSYTSDVVHFAQTEMLKSVCALVATYYKNDEVKNRGKFNASIMVVEERDAWLQIGTSPWQFQDSVRFFDSNRNPQACAKVLHLTCWAEEPPGWGKFILPVDDDADYCLPGAPRALKSGHIESVPDTRDKGFWEKELSKHATTATHDLRIYFEKNERSFLSFFCLPLRIEKDGEIVGILNVQSKDTDILGVENENGDDLELCLRPICSLLAMLIEREKASHGDSNG